MTTNRKALNLTKENGEKVSINHTHMAEHYEKARQILIWMHYGKR